MEPSIPRSLLSSLCVSVCLLVYLSLFFSSVSMPPLSMFVDENMICHLPVLAVVPLICYHAYHPWWNLCLCKYKTKWTLSSKSHFWSWCFITVIPALPKTNACGLSVQRKGVFLICFDTICVAAGRNWTRILAGSIFTVFAGDVDTTVLFPCILICVYITQFFFLLYYNQVFLIRLGYFEKIDELWIESIPFILMFYSFFETLNLHNSNISKYKIV